MSKLVWAACASILMLALVSCSKYGSDDTGFSGRPARRFIAGAKPGTSGNSLVGQATLPELPTLPPEAKGYYFQFYDYSLNSHYAK